jgi:hypothetical protein
LRLEEHFRIVIDYQIGRDRKSMKFSCVVLVINDYLYRLIFKLYLND